MRDALITLGLAVAIFVGIIVQEFVPPLAVAEGARLLLTPVFFCYGACFLPYPCMIVLALVAGFLSDFTSLQIVQHTIASSDPDAIHTYFGTVELSAGWSILLYVAFGSICQGLRALVLRGHWWLPPLMSAATTMVYLALQFGILTMRRFDTGGLFWSEVVAWRIFAPAVLASLLTLVLVLAGVLISGASGENRRVLRDY
jgi:hypothetical protein